MTGSTLNGLESYDCVQKIGEGTYSNVYKARNIHTKQLVALKEIRLQDSDGTPSTALREIAFLREIHHPNIVRLLNVIHDDSRLVLVFECMNQDLKQLLDIHSFSKVLSLNPHLPVWQIKLYMYQLLRGVAWCHAHHIMHRDLKPQNLLLDDSGQILKLADFGLARGFGVPVAAYSNEVVTLWYRAPEVLLGANNYGTTIDMWSIGCIMAEMHRGTALFPGNTNEDQLKRIFRVLGSPSTEQWPHLLSRDGNPENIPINADGYIALPLVAQELPYYPPCSFKTLFPSMDSVALSLIARFLDYRPLYRISAAESLYHPYFHDMRK